MTTQQADVLIVGAGAAGLAAAYELCRNELNVLLLEARDRIGGRIFTLNLPSIGTPIELGAEFIHGKPPNIWEIIRRARVNAQQLTGQMWCTENGDLRLCDELFDGVDKVFEAMEKTVPDRTFAEFLLTHRQQFPAKAKELATSYVEGFHASRADRISVHSLIKSNEADEKIQGDLQFRIAEGYATLVQGLVRQIPSRHLRVLLDTTVTNVEWQPGRVSLEAKGPSQAKQLFVAPAVIVTIPLGVLKAARRSAGSVEFVPRLDEKRRSLDRLEMGAVVRVSFHFKKRFWAERDFLAGKQGDLSKMGFLFAPNREFPTWWTMLPREAPVLTAWAAGPRAEALSKCDGDERKRRALRMLAEIFKMGSERLEKLVHEAFTHDWQADPFSRGGYSYCLVGGAEAARKLAAPIAGTLFFAGEATDFTGHHGTVHGALASGTRAAQEVLRSRSQRVAS